MQGDMRFTHFSDRFQEYYGRPFTQIDKRNILDILKNRRFRQLNSYYEHDVRLLISYEGRNLILIIGKKDATFITCYPCVERFKGMEVK
jgi:hypothetical protein